ncbi:MAG: hypothetical protein K9J74_05930 [Sulfuritalea sp.]|nr:hypothetical protein [Sulfuritalea sp.]
MLQDTFATLQEYRLTSGLRQQVAVQRAVHTPVEVDCLHHGSTLPYVPCERLAGAAP